MVNLRIKSSYIFFYKKRKNWKEKETKIGIKTRSDEVKDIATFL